MKYQAATANCTSSKSSLFLDQNLQGRHILLGPIVRMYLDQLAF